MGKLFLALLAASTCTALKDYLPQATAPAHIAVRQDAPAPVTLGSRDVYLQAPTSTASPTGTQIRFLPSTFPDNAIPSGGLDMFFGSDLTASLSSTIAEKCGSGASDECISSLSGVLNQRKNAELQARVVGVDDALIGIAALVGLVSVLIGGYLQSKEAPSVVHIPSADLAQIKSQTGSGIPIVTSEGATITVPATLPSASDTGPTTASIYTLTAAEGSHSSGIQVVAVPSDTADLADQLLAMSGSCANPNDSPDQKKRQNGVDYTGVNGAGAFLLANAAPGGVLNAFGLAASSQLPRLRDEAAQASWDALRAAADTMPDISGLASSFKDTLTTANWQAAYQWCIEGLNDAAENFYFDEMLWIHEDGNGSGSGGNGEDNNDDPQCLADAPRGYDALRCDDEECKGNEGRCTVGDAQHCDCLPSTYYDPYPGKQADWEAGQYILEALLSDGPEEEELNKALSIVLEVKDDSFQWLFYQINQGEMAQCTDNGIIFRDSHFGGADIEHPPLPGGEHNFTIWSRNCKWSGNGGNPGEMWCDNDRYGCHESEDETTRDCATDGTKQHQGVYCDFHSDGDASPSVSEPEPEKNVALSIVLEKKGDNYQWLYYQIKQGEMAQCGDNTILDRSSWFQGSDINNPPLPGGQLDLNIWSRGCRWSGNGENPGELICDKDRYGCAKSDNGAVKDCPTTQQHQGVYCDFHSDGGPSPGGGSSDPAPNSPIGESCNPQGGGDIQGCTADKSELVYCYCGDGACKWTSFGKCQGGSKTCHKTGENGNHCGIAFQYCC